MKNDHTMIKLIKWPLRPLVRLFFRIRGWLKHRQPQIVYQLFWKPRGHSWIEYYSNRLDKYAEANIMSHNYCHSKQFKNYVHGVKPQADLLKKYGLLPQHMFLDYGCGQLRLANYLIDYLELRKYVGVDISKKRIELGKMFLNANGYKDNQYKTITVRDCLLKQLNNIKFDFVWAYSVFTHMPEEDILQMLQSLKPLLSENGQYLFSFSHMKKTKIIGKDFYYSFDDMEALCKKAGYHYEVLEPAWPVDFSAIAKVQLTQ